MGSPAPGPIAIVDVGYGEQQALAACVVAGGWADATPVEARVMTVTGVRPYAPGRFFERELPCVLAVLGQMRTQVRAIVVDGYVVLDEHGAPGLGGYLHAALRGEPIVIGVAKTAYRGSGFATPVLRGASARPLWVTATGIEVERAAELVAGMHGEHRIPTLLGLVDRLTRGIAAIEGA